MSGQVAAGPAAVPPAAVPAEHRPYTLIAELTYKCPLRCPYCSNPLDYARHGAELDTAAWLRALREAEELGEAGLDNYLETKTVTVSLS